ncbi:MMPL/RND family transporter [[Mycobacterium] manitobense]|nr:RND family transporter [[Mycobacterium] manitobense]
MFTKSGTHRAESKPSGDAFSALGRFVVRAPWVMIGAWVALLIVLSVFCTPLAKVVQSQQVQPLPPAAMAATNQMAKEFGESAQNIMVVVLTDKDKKDLGPADEATYREVATTLRADTDQVASVQDYLTTPPLRQLMVSKDNQAAYMAVILKAPAGSPESSAAYKQITETVKHTTEGTGLSADVTGQAAMMGDLSNIGEHDMHMIELATMILVLSILLVIYRRPVTVLLPLIVIGVSVTAAEGAVSALTHAGLSVSLLTMVLMTTMVAGAGTDYAVFLISRYHEYIGDGMDSDAAVRKALSSIGKVIAASAATVAVTFLGMIFAKLPWFTSVGPALAVSIAVALLAAITLLPAVLVLAGRRGWVKPRRSLTGRLWQRSAVHIVRKPKIHLAASLVVLISLASCAAFLHPTFNDRLQLPQSAESNVGFSAMQDHFSTSALLPQYIYIHSPHDLRTAQSLADMEQMAQRVSQLPNIAAVRGITRPDGKPLDQTKLSYQAGQVGDALHGASTQISDKDRDLDALTSGADQLAATLASVRDQVHSASGSVSGLTSTLGQVQGQLNTAANLVDSIRGMANSSTAALTQASGTVNQVQSELNGPQCTANPLCSAGRSALGQVIPAGNSTAAPGMLSTVQNLTGQLDTAINTLRNAAGGGAATIQSEVSRVQSGADQLADGSAKLAAGVHTLVDQTKKMGAGLNQASDLLLSMKQNATSPAMAGMYIPSQVLDSNDFKKAAQLFISPDGHSARYTVETTFDPFSTQAMDQVSSILDTARGAQPNTSLSDATISMVGTTAMYSTIRSDYNSDVELIIAVTLAVVFIILVLLLRALVAPLYLIVSVVLSFLSAMGTGVLFFQVLLGQSIHWSVAATAFIVLVAVGADYNLLLITRIREESGSGIRTGIIRAIRSTGGVITSAGIIFAASMFGLLFGSLTTMMQTGFIIGVGLLIDTFVVRTITVPALATLLGPANWWPARPGTAAARHRR